MPWDLYFNQIATRGVSTPAGVRTGLGRPLGLQPLLGCLHSRGACAVLRGAPGTVAADPRGRTVARLLAPLSRGAVGARLLPERNAGRHRPLDDMGRAGRRSGAIAGRHHPRDRGLCDGARLHPSRDGVDEPDLSRRRRRAGGLALAVSAPSADARGPDDDPAGRRILRHQGVAARQQRHHRRPERGGEVRLPRPAVDARHLQRLSDARRAVAVADRARRRDGRPAVAADAARRRGRRRARPAGRRRRHQPADVSVRPPQRHACPRPGADPGAGRSVRALARAGPRGRSNGMPRSLPSRQSPTASISCCSAATSTSA